MHATSKNIELERTFEKNSQPHAYGYVPLWARSGVISTRYDHMIQGLQILRVEKLTIQNYFCYKFRKFSLISEFTELVGAATISNLGQENTIWDKKTPIMTLFGTGY